MRRRPATAAATTWGRVSSETACEDPLCPNDAASNGNGRRAGRRAGGRAAGQAGRRAEEVVACTLEARGELGPGEGGPAFDVPPRVGEGRGGEGIT